LALDSGEIVMAGTDVDPLVFAEGVSSRQGEHVQECLGGLFGGRLAAVLGIGQGFFSFVHGSSPFSFK